MSLPIEEVLPALRQCLSERHECVLQAPPGAGKTTLVPLALLDQPWLAGRKILLLEPRRLAARAAALRMAQLLNEPVGQTVGYRVRLETKVSRATRIEVVTEGILNRLLQEDPSLDEVGLLIFDEFHERSLDADLGLALALGGRELYGDLRDGPLKILVMSATLDGCAVARLLDDAPVLKSEGRAYPVALRYGSPGGPVNGYGSDQVLLQRLLDTIEQALADQPGSLLVFLPGQAEIRRLAERLTERHGQDPGLLIAPLYGDLGFAEQKAAIEPAAPGTRKIVLATNIAETSLTIDGIGAVVDAGLCREPEFDPNSGLTRLATRRISRAASAQRAGRAGRTGPGLCYRLWSESQQAELAAYGRPEIEQADLTGLALQLLAWGIGSPDELRWLSPPPPGAWAQALALLSWLGAAQGSGSHWRITGHGQAMARLPAHPRLAHLLVMAAHWGQPALGAQLAAVLSERDPLGPLSSADLGRRLDWLAGAGRSSRQAQLAHQFSQLLKALPTGAPQPADEALAAALLAQAYPDRIAQRRAGGLVYQLANGRSAQLRETDSLRNSEWLVVADTGARAGQAVDNIYLALALDAGLFDTLLAPRVQDRLVAGWDDKAGRFIAERQWCVGRLLVRRRPEPLDAGHKQQALLGLVRERGLALLNWTESARQWRGRLALVRDTLAESGADSWPDFSDAALLDSLDQWLAPYLDGVNKLADFAGLDVLALLQARLGWDRCRQLDALAPERLTVPSGNSAAIDYCQRPPVLAVKLQEMFGERDTPRLVQGRVPVLLHLLSPARRPLQITQDLAGFWAGSYQAVKKDMKGRYPKHPWPDDPLQAMPTARTKAAQLRQEK